MRNWDLFWEESRSRHVTHGNATSLVEFSLAVPSLSKHILLCYHLSNENVLNIYATLFLNHKHGYSIEAWKKALRLTSSHLIKSTFLLMGQGPNPVSILRTSLDSQCAQLRCSWRSLKMPSIFLKAFPLIIFFCLHHSIHHSKPPYACQKQNWSFRSVIPPV